MGMFRRLFRGLGGRLRGTKPHVPRGVKKAPDKKSFKVTVRVPTTKIDPKTNTLVIDPTTKKPAKVDRKFTGAAQRPSGQFKVMELLTQGTNPSLVKSKKIRITRVKIKATERGLPSINDRQIVIANYRNSDLTLGDIVGLVDEGNYYLGKNQQGEYFLFLTE